MQVRRCIKEAFLAGLIDDEILLDMLEDRNRCSHIYDESTVKENYERIVKIYVPTLESILKGIKIN